MPPRTPVAVRAVALLALESAVVVALHQLGRWQWMRIRWGDLDRWLASPPEDVLLGTVRTAALVLAWWLLLSTATCILATASRAPRGLRSMRWAMFPGVRRLLDGLVALSIVSSTSSAEMPGTHASPIVEVTPDRLGPALAPPDELGLRVAVYRAVEPLPTPPEDGRAYTVKAGDSLWDIADAELGDGTRWAELWNLNRARLEAAGADGPGTLMVGWALQLPDQAPQPPATEQPTHVVGPGDTLSSIAAARLGDADRYVELADLNRGRPQPDGRALTDPNAISPGWVITLPGPQPAPAAPQAPQAPRPPAPTPSPTEAPPTTTRPDTEPAPPPTTAATPTTAVTPTVQGPGDEGGDGSGTSALPFVTGIAGATVLATGLALHLRQAQRRRLARGGVRGLWQAANRRAARTDAAIFTAADIPLVRWAGQELAAAIAAVDVDQLDGATPVAVELSDDGIEVLWDRPVPTAPPRWAPTDGGWAWRLPYDPTADAPPDALCSPLPALVTVGQRNGRQLLVDIEALGSLQVTGDPARITDFARAIGLELSADDDMADAFVSTVGLGLGVEDHLQRVRRATPAEALSQLHTASDAADHALSDAGLASTFELRAGASGAPLEAVVVVTTTNDTAAEMIASSPPHRGVATIVVGETPDAHAQLTIDADGTAELRPIGITFTAAGVPETTADEIAQVVQEHDVLDDIEDVDIEIDPFSLARLPDSGPTARHDDDQLALVPSDPPTPDGPAAFTDDGPADPGEANDPGEPDRLLVHVLGKPRVEGHPNLGRKEVALATYLACHPGDTDPSRVTHAVWGGKAVEGKTLWNLISRTRRALGQFPDGHDMIPSANRRSNTLRADERVVTDLDLLRAAHEDAHDAPTSVAARALRDALAEVDGPPFDAPGYEWARHDELYVADANQLIESAAERLVQLAMDNGDIELARWGLIQGLRGLPGNEVLYRARMRIEHAAGNLTAVREAWQELNSYLLDLDTDPADATRNLYEQLVPPAVRARPRPA